MTEARVRIGWRDLPEAVRSRAEEIIGDRVVSAESQAGGFSPGTADRVVTDSGRRAFVKAVTPAVNTRSAELARQEMHITSAMPEHAPVPRMLGGFDDGEWVVLILEDVDGANPRTPWVESEVDAAVTALAELAAAVTPSPVPGAPSAADAIADDFAGWHKIAGDRPADLDPWLAERLDDLRAAADRALAAVATGDTLVHFDIRADNMLIRPDGRVVIVDWPWGCVGPAWLDRLLLGLDVLVKGGDPARVFEGIDPGVVTDVIAGIDGMFEHICRLPPPPGIPTLRAFQRSAADAIRPWLRGRL
jgi:aminoglycoside phosphotransferase (APT) family kinase protein